MSAPNISYNLNIPFATNNPSVDQPNMETNTNNIASYVAIDHIPFSTMGSGWHNKSTYADQLSDPGSLSGTYVQYAKSSSGSSELFAQKDGVTSPVQVTRGVPLVAATPGYTYLPGGILMQWTNLTFSGNTATFTFPVAYTTLFSVLIGPQGNVAFVLSTGTTNVVINRTAFTTNCWVTVLGV